MVKKVLHMKCHSEKTAPKGRDKDKLNIIHSLPLAVIGSPPPFYHFVVLCSYCTATVFENVYNLKI